MDYSKIRLLMVQRNFSARKLAREIGMSDVGFNTMMEKQTMKVEYLERLCDVFNVSVSYFFGEEENGRKTCRECHKKDAKLELLKELLDEKEKEIARLNQELGRKVGTEDGKVA